MSAEKTALRETMRQILDYLQVKKEDELYKTLGRANESDLAKMFYELSLALSEMTEDKTILKNIRVQLPDGTIVGYDEAHEYAKKQTLSSPQDRIPKHTPAPVKDNFGELVEMDCVEHGFRPIKRAKSSRRR